MGYISAQKQLLMCSACDVSLQLRRIPDRYVIQCIRLTFYLADKRFIAQPDYIVELLSFLGEKIFALCRFMRGYTINFFCELKWKNSAIFLLSVVNLRANYFLLDSVLD